jgi:hypothetical protein
MGRFAILYLTIKFAQDVDLDKLSELMATLYSHCNVYVDNNSLKVSYYDIYKTLDNILFDGLKVTENYGKSLDDYFTFFVNGFLTSRNLPIISYIKTTTDPEFGNDYEMTIEDTIIIENIQNKQLKYEYYEISKFKKEFAYNNLVKHFIPDLANIICKYF